MVDTRYGVGGEKMTGPNRTRFRVFALIFDDASIRNDPIHVHANYLAVKFRRKPPEE